MKVKNLDFESICGDDDHYIASVPFGTFELLYQYDGMWRTMYDLQEFGEPHKYKKYAIEQCNERLKCWINSCLTGELT